MNNKIDKEFKLSDSTVNCYGFRLLTSGYQLSEFQKNPIGYYMHERDAGIIVRWENLYIKNDSVFGKPVINLSHPRAKQTIDEVENGFLNAASVGSIVVLDYTDDERFKVQGQTGVTVTKWYNRECSLVDIPGNMNALVLFDKNENNLTLSDLKCSTLDNLTKDNGGLFGRIYTASEVYKMEWDELHSKDLLTELKERNFQRFKTVYKNCFSKEYTL